MDHLSIMTVSLECLNYCSSALPWVVTRLLVNIVATPIFFCLRLTIYQVEAEHSNWIDYIGQVSRAIQMKFGFDISGDMSILHIPVATSLKIYNKAASKLKTQQPQHFQNLLKVPERGLTLSGKVRGRQTGECCTNLVTLHGAAAAAQIVLKKLVEPRISSLQHKPLSWSERSSIPHPMGIPAALYAYDPGVKLLSTLQKQASLRYEGDFSYFVDAARLVLVFDSCKALLCGLGQIESTFAVVALVNGFANPAPIGLRNLSIVVKVPITGFRNGTRDCDLDDDNNDSDCDNTGRCLFLAQFDLHVTAFAQAQEDAQVHQRRFMADVAGVCCAVPEQQKAEVQDMIAHMVMTARPSAAGIHSGCCGCRGSDGMVSEEATEPVLGQSGRDIFQSTPQHIHWTKQQEAIPVDMDMMGMPAAMEEGSVGDQAGNLQAQMRWMSSINRGLTDDEGDDDDGDDDGTDDGGENDEEGIAEPLLQGKEAAWLAQVTRQVPDTVWYDVRWVLQLNASAAVVVAQDTLVLLKTLAASVALFYVTRPRQLIVCDAVASTADHMVLCRPPPPAAATASPRAMLQTDQSRISASVVESRCRPRIDLGPLDSSFTALIAANQLVFVTFIALRFAAYRRWPCVARARWVRRHSLHVAAAFFVGALVLAGLKVYIAFSYHRAPITYAGVHAAHRPYLRYELLLANCTNTTTVGNGWRSSMVGGGGGGDGRCFADIRCDRQCRLQNPPALEGLCGMFVLATSYIAYLGYDFHRSVTCDPHLGTLTGRVARLARALAPVMRWLPDVSALLKYVLAAGCIWLSLADADLVSCRAYRDEVRDSGGAGGGANGTRVLKVEVGGAEIEAGCRPDVHAPLSAGRALFAGLSGVQAALFAASILVKQRTLFAHHAAALLKGFTALQVVVVGVQIMAVGRIALLSPRFSCADRSGTAGWAEGAHSLTLTAQTGILPECLATPPTTVLPTPGPHPPAPTPPTPIAPTPVPSLVPTMSPTLVPTLAPTHTGLGQPVCYMGAQGHQWLNFTVLMRRYKPSPPEKKYWCDLQNPTGPRCVEGSTSKFHVNKTVGYCGDTAQCVSSLFNRCNRISGKCEPCEEGTPGCVVKVNCKAVCGGHKPTPAPLPPTPPPTFADPCNQFTSINDCVNPQKWPTGVSCGFCIGAYVQYKDPTMPKNAHCAAFAGGQPDMCICPTPGIWCQGAQCSQGWNCVGGAGSGAAKCSNAMAPPFTYQSEKECEEGAGSLPACKASAWVKCNKTTKKCDINCKAGEPGCNTMAFCAATCNVQHAKCDHTTKICTPCDPALDKGCTMTKGSCDTDCNKN